MRVKVRFMCVDIPIGLGNGEIEVEKGMTVKEIVTECAKRHKIKMPLKELFKSVFLIDASPATLGSVLKDGEELTVVRTMAGG